MPHTNCVIRAASDSWRMLRRVGHNSLRCWSASDGGLEEPLSDRYRITSGSQRPVQVGIGGFDKQVVADHERSNVAASAACAYYRLAHRIAPHVDLSGAEGEFLE